MLHWAVGPAWLGLDLKVEVAVDEDEAGAAGTGNRDVAKTWPVGNESQGCQAFPRRMPFRLLALMLWRRFVWEAFSKHAVCLSLHLRCGLSLILGKQLFSTICVSS